MIRSATDSNLDESEAADSWMVLDEMLDEDDDVDNPNLLVPLVVVVVVPFAVTLAAALPLPVLLYADDETDLPDGQ